MLSQPWERDNSSWVRRTEQAGEEGKTVFQSSVVDWELKGKSRKVGSAQKKSQRQEHG